MFKWVPFPFLRFSAYLIIGILIYDSIGRIETVQVLISLGGLTVLYVTALFFRASRVLTGVLGLFMIVLLGYSLSLASDDVRDTRHYSHFVGEKVEAFSGKVISAPLEKENYIRYTVKLRYSLVGDEAIDRAGDLHLYIMRDENIRTLAYGDIVLISGGYSEIPSPQNPHEFDYSRYIRRSQIYGQCFVSPDRIKVTGNNPDNEVIALALNTRSIAATVIDTYVKSNREKAILSALILGIKDHLDNDIKKAYATAGAMHVLAVSGLHVGIIYLLLMRIFGWLKRSSYTKWLYALLIMLSIWFFAFVTGLSPSVMRAATMFSILVLREVYNARSNIYNSIGVALFVLLIVNPNFIYSVGFQLSFIAVFGIVFFHPKIYRMYSAPNRILDWAWSITCISIAAQLSTFPLTLYYFHQFPTYFLLSNLVVIPAAGLLMNIGLPFVILGAISPLLGQILGKVVYWISYGLNESMMFVERLPLGLIDWIYFTKTEALLIYLVIIFFFLALQYRSLVSTIIWMSGLALFFIMDMENGYLISEQKKLVIYEIRDKTAIDLIDGSKSQLLIDEFDSAELELLQFQIDPNRLASGLKSISEDITTFDESGKMIRLDSFRLFIWSGFRFLILDQPIDNVEVNIPIEADFVVLTNNIRVDKQRFQKLVKCSSLIISSDCAPWYARRFTETGFPFPVHYISKDGHWMLDLNKKQL